MPTDQKERPRKRTTLFEKISMRLLLVGVMPLAILAAITVALLFLSYQGTNAVFETTVLNLKRTETDRFVLSTVNEFRFVVDPAAVGADGLLDARQQESLIERLFEAHLDELEELSFLHSIPAVTEIPEGQETARCIRAGETEAGFRCATAGLRVDSGIPLRDRLNDPLFASLTKGGAAVYVGPVDWPEGGEPIIEFGVPIVLKTAEGTIISTIVAGRLHISDVKTIYEETDLPGLLAVFLIDHEGRVLAHSETASLVGESADSLLEMLRNEAAEAAEAGPPQMITAVRKRVFEKGSAFTSVLPLNFGATQWFVVAEWPLADAFLEVIFIASLLAIVWLILLIAVHFIGRHLSRSITDPIRQVQRRAAEIGQGDFSGTLELQTNDEIEDLGKSLNEMAKDLERLERVRSAETRAQALAVAIQKEHQLEEEKDVLLKTASHQFRTPVTALKWTISILRTKDLPDDVSELVDGIAEHSKNLAVIANDLLNTTAFGAGYRAEPDAAPVDLGAVLERVFEDSKTRISDAKLVLERNMPKEPLQLQGSSVALRIAIQQLFDNAITYSDSGATITVKLELMGDGNAEIIIADTGIGIPADEQQYLFNTFFRATNAITKKNVGTGLGLSIAYNIIIGHGGDIEIVSEEGKGTRVIVRLPGVHFAAENRGV